MGWVFGLRRVRGEALSVSIADAIAIKTMRRPMVAFKVIITVPPASG